MVREPALGVRADYRFLVLKSKDDAARVHSRGKPVTATGSMGRSSSNRRH